MPTVTVTFVQAIFVLATIAHMANIHQDEHSIRNMQVVSSNRAHSTHSCHFFCLSDKRCLMLIFKKELKKINLSVSFLPLKIAFFLVFENDNILSSKSPGYAKVEYLLNESLDLYEI